MIDPKFFHSKERQSRAHGLDRVADAGGLMGRQVVHHDDIAGLWGVGTSDASRPERTAATARSRRSTDTDRAHIPAGLHPGRQLESP